jgi:hypothetical protein
MDQSDEAAQRFSMLVLVLQFVSLRTNYWHSVRRSTCLIHIRSSVSIVCQIIITVVSATSALIASSIALLFFRTIYFGMQLALLRSDAMVPMEPRAIIQ